MSKYLANFIPYLPPFEMDQKHTIDWATQLHQQLQEEEYHQRIAKSFSCFAVSPEKIHTRRTFLQDFTSYEWQQHHLIGKHQGNPHLGHRSQIAQEICLKIFSELYFTQQQPPDQILHVSCTHYESPSAAQMITTQKEWFETPVTHLYHMGCYAALPAIRVASALVDAGNKRIDINHTELCSFHFDPTRNDPQSIILQTLFADGAIHYQMKDHLTVNQVNLELLAQHEILVGDTCQEMKWMLGNQNFQMTLSKQVPILIKNKINGFFQKLFNRAGLDFGHCKDDCEFAIHPGGPKIIEAVAQTLELGSDQYEKSIKVLQSRGNMSSATLPHIWGMITDEPKYPFVATVAFGPGLTLTGALFKVW